MSVLLAMGFIAAKAANGYPPELALVSQPVMVYNYNSITVYYDVQNIGDYTYRGYVYLYLDPDNGYYYADKYVRVCPGRIKRIAIDIPAYRPNPAYAYTIMPYYELGDELYSFTTFEYFEPLSFYWNGPRTEHWVVTYAPPRPRYYTRPGDYRYYYDGYRPPMPPPTAVGYGPGPGTLPPPMDPMHHTYSYHYNNGGYPATHNVAPPAPNGTPTGSATDGSSTVPKATVRPNPNAGSMSHGNGNGNNGGTNPPAPNGNHVAPSSNNSTSVGTTTNGSSSGRTGNSNVSRPSNNNGTSAGTTNNGSSSGRTGNSNVSRPSNNGTSTGSTTNGSSSGRAGNSSVSRPSSNNGTSAGTTSNGSSSTRSGNSNRGSSSSSTRSGSNSGRGGR